MKIIDKILGLFSFRRRIMVDAQAEPNDLKAQISAIRSWAYFRITGKKLPKMYTSSGPEDSTVTDIGSDLSPSRRLARRSK